MAYSSRTRADSGNGGGNWIRPLIKWILPPAVLFILVFSGCAGCTKVEPGYMGIRVNLYGSHRGVSSYPIVTGRVWYNPLTEDVWQYPTFMQNVVWSGSEGFTANSSDGISFGFIVGLSYRIDGEKVPQVFLTFRENTDQLTNVYIHNQVRDFFNLEASKVPITDIMGVGKSKLILTVFTDLKDKLGPYGIMVDNLSIVGQIKPRDQSITDAINNVVEAEQQAKAAEQKVAQSKAEAEQKIAKANGDAQAILINAKAQANANTVLAKSISDDYIRYLWASNWDGKMPQVMGGGTPLVEIPKAGQ